MVQRSYLNIPELYDLSIYYLAGQYLNDLHHFDPQRMAWTELSINSQGATPSPRKSMGFVADDAGKLYCFGGADGQGS